MVFMEIIKNEIFISHSSKDTDVLEAIKEAFAELKIKPFFAELEVAGVPPTKEITDRIKQSKALFVFFTYNTTMGETRDWIVFELGVAVAHSKPIYAWRVDFVMREQLPRMVEQVSKYSNFSLQNPQGVMKLVREVKTAARRVGEET